MRRDVFQKLIANILLFGELQVTFPNFLGKPIKIRNKTRKITDVI